MDSVRTDFEPHVHGFQFANRFDFPHLLQITLPLKSPIPIALGDIVYGLCGGMCFAAQDYHLSTKSIPAFTEADEISLKLFIHLWARQLASLKSDVAKKVFLWMLRPDASLARSVAGWEVPKVRHKLDNGEPAVLALIRVKGISDPARNHQVLATGYDFDSDTKRMSIYLYDPNHPRQAPALAMNLKKPSLGIDLAQSTGERVRGFFVIDYRHQTPP